ncbi:hypothetical protein Ancab_002181 [Ancistrocladus abbreviatus]
MDRSGQIDTNLRDLRAKLKDQVFHDFKDQVHYVRAHVRVRRSATKVDPGKSWKVVCLTLAYSIWLCRNKVVFGGSVESKHKLMDTVQCRSFGYITTKLDLKEMSFHSWISNLLAAIVECLQLGE